MRDVISARTNQLKKRGLGTLLMLSQLLFCGLGFAQTGWTKIQINSPMDDNLGFSLASTHISVKSGSASELPIFGIQCTKKKGLQVVFLTKMPLTTSGNVNDSSHKGELGGLFSKNSGASLSPVRLRFDQQNPRREEWIKGSDPSNLLAPKPKRFVDALLKDKVQSLLIEVWPSASDSVIFEVDVRGLEQYKAMLHEGCNY
jgi:hypothetical protein